MRRGLITLGIVLMLCMWTTTSSGLDAGFEEYRVKGAFLFNFLKYVEWTQSPVQDSLAPLIIVIYGEDPFGSQLDRDLDDRHIDSHPVKVVRIPQGDSIPDCHLVYTTLRDNNALEALLSDLRGVPVLTVGESENFLSLGGVISLLLEDGKVRFDIDLDHARRARIDISSKLLNLARQVRSDR